MYSTIEALKKRITALQKDHKTQSCIYEAQISKLKQDFDQLKTENISLTKLLQESDSKNFSLNEELKRNKQRISTLENDLGNCKESFTKLLKATKVS
ncbi:hypothetical protein Avbf_11724 [Armadillidium vulgare]|nr:hypothetical protein Avbf_11724 [Armadillidium vulgare]